LGKLFFFKKIFGQPPITKFTTKVKKKKKKREKYKHAPPPPPQITHDIHCVNFHHTRTRSMTLHDKSYTEFYQNLSENVGSVCKYEYLVTHVAHSCNPATWRPVVVIVLTWRIWRALNNTSRRQMGFNSAFKGLSFFWIIFGKEILCQISWKSDRCLVAAAR